MGEKARISIKKRCWHSKNRILNLQNSSFRRPKMAQNSPRSGNRCSRSSFGVPKKSPQRHKNQNSCSRSSFWPLNGHFWGARGAENSIFTMCLSRFCKKPKTGKTAQKVNYRGNSETGATGVCRVFGEITHESGPPRGGPIGGDPLRRRLPQPRYPIVRWGRRI
jgi:hypothetical protein